MSNREVVKYYSQTEERLNISSHVVGLVLSVIALVFLTIRANQHGDIFYLVSFSVFGSSLILLYAASVAYHSIQDPNLRSKFRILDHISIYILIAGSYTPYTLVTLNGETGWILFGIAWSVVICGLILKLFFTGKYKVVSTLLYLAMGWMAIFAINPLMNNLSTEGLFWLVAGGLAYTVGAVLYSIKKIKYNHAIFHVFVVVGSFCHFISVYFYV